MKLQEKLKLVRSEKTALLATNYYNMETCKGIIFAAKELKQPIILQLSKSSIDYMGLKTAVQIGRTLSEEYEVESWLHLDHSGEIELIKKCLDEGFDSVMIDASDKSFDENISITKKVVDLAKNYGANVEAELGSVPKLGKELENDKFTKPDEARIFAKETGIDALAVAIGTKHGFYMGEPKLDFLRLQEIRQSTDVQLVLHGGSGIPETSLKKAIELGITKINVATEIKDIFTKTIKEIVMNTDEIDIRIIFPDAITAVKKLVLSKLKAISLKQ